MDTSIGTFEQAKFTPKCAAADEAIPYTPCHPHAQHLDASLAKVLSLHLFHLVWWNQIPSRNLPNALCHSGRFLRGIPFARKAIPSLHHHVEDNVTVSLDKGVSNSMHLTANMWFSKHGQGRHISFTAHWVTFLAAGMDAWQGLVLELVVPPHLRTDDDAAAPINSTPCSCGGLLSCYAPTNLCRREEPH